MNTKQENDEIAEQILADKKQTERAQTAPRKVESHQVKMAKHVWMIGAVVIDVVTAVLVWKITGWLPYGVFWFLAGAVGLIWSDYLRDRIGNNATQTSIGERGVVVSGLAILVMALLAGVCYVLGFTRLVWVEALTVVATVGLVLYHVFMAYIYYNADDAIKEENREALLNAAAEKQILEIHRAARIVAAKKARLAQLHEYEGEHGAAMNAALIAMNSDTTQTTTLRENGKPKKEDPT